MCRIYNTIGSLTALKTHLRRNSIYDFKSLKEVMDFQKSYSTLQQQLIVQHESLVAEEKNMLHTYLPQLENEIASQRKQSEQRLKEELATLRQELDFLIHVPSKNIIKKLARKLKQRACEKKIREKESLFDVELESSVYDLTNNYRFKADRYQFLCSDLAGAAKQSAYHALSELERKKTSIDKANTFIYGALGEQKVVKTLEALPDDYFLINDFAVRFSPGIVNRKENDYIKSVQIDHILVGPGGVFLIETKNWSDRSLGDWSLRSPVQQVKRFNFALFTMLNNEVSNYHLRLNRHHWGDKKIPIRNLIVLTNSKPKEEFQHVKVLTLPELLGYIKYFQPIFSYHETQRIAEFLIALNAQETLVTA